ncbi:MAG TPA: 3-hydroxyacyl-CoA dehydrogenase, partial [Curvibacter sp.]|nr:3-hydroxyacyl-CoA dehydrogenase [Curvibacter sp.]
MQAIYAHIAVVGIGAMGRGIAQIAAQAGSTVALYDQQPAAIAAAQQAIAEQWDKQVEKGRLDPTAAAAYKERLRAATSLKDLANCDLVVEAIVEKLEVKAALFAELEGIVRADAVLASNTSSLSITAIAAKLQRPQR